MRAHQDLGVLDPEPHLALRPPQLLVLVRVAPVGEREVAQRALVDVEYDRVGAIADAGRVDLEALRVNDPASEGEKEGRRGERES